jgi:hypothetical protein
MISLVLVFVSILATILPSSKSDERFLQSSNLTFVPADSANITMMGRYAKLSGGVIQFGWPAVTLSFNVVGTCNSVLVSMNGGNS